MGTFVLNIMEMYGYIGICLLIAIENIFPPIPSEVILTFGGFLTTYTKLTPFGVIISSTIGSLIGAIILYYLGSFIKVKKENQDKGNYWFNKYKEKSVLFGRCIPIVRSIISIPAGSIKMDMKKFILYTTIGSLIWNFILVYSGVILGSNWPVFAKILSKYSKIVLVILIVIIAIKIYKSIKNDTKI